MRKADQPHLQMAGGQIPPIFGRTGVGDKSRWQRQAFLKQAAAGALQTGRRIRCDRVLGQRQDGGVPFVPIGRGAASDICQAVP